MQQFAVGLDGGDHAGQRVFSTEQAADFGLNTRPDAGAELTQQLVVEVGVQLQTLGDGQDELPVRHGRANILGHVQGGQQRAFLVAGWARAALLAGKGDDGGLGRKKSF